MVRTIFVLPVNPESTLAVHLFPLKNFQNPEIWFLIDEDVEGSLDFLDKLKFNIDIFQFRIISKSNVSLFDYYSVLFETLRKFGGSTSPFNNSEEIIEICINESTNVAPAVYALLQGFAILKNNFPQIQIRPVFVRRDQKNIPKENQSIILPDPSVTLREEDIQILQILRDQEKGFDSQVELLNAVMKIDEEFGRNLEAAGQMKISRILRRLTEYGFVRSTPSKKTNRIELGQSITFKNENYKLRVKKDA